MKFNKIISIFFLNNLSKEKKRQIDEIFKIVNKKIYISSNSMEKKEKRFVNPGLNAKHVILVIKLRYLIKNKNKKKSRSSASN
jgi:hypothetical protein